MWVPEFVPQIVGTEFAIDFPLTENVSSKQFVFQFETVFTVAGPVVVPVFPAGITPALRCVSETVLVLGPVIVNVLKSILNWHMLLLIGQTYNIQAVGCVVDK
jgi:hypothetical protein